MSKSESEGATIPPEIQKMSFEEAREGLEEIVQRLEGGEVSLDASIDMYTRGTLLMRHCEAKLRAAQERIDKIVVGEGGAVDTEPAALD
jgi:exodeoxyribonuclease VII small subunit